MKITDKMIEDIKCADCTSIDCNKLSNKKSCIKFTKEELKKKGYEVEDEKTALDQFKNIDFSFWLAGNLEKTDMVVYKKDYIKALEIAEKAIEEIQDKQIAIDNDLIEWLKLIEQGVENYSFRSYQKYAKKLLKQLGEKNDRFKQF